VTPSTKRATRPIKRAAANLVQSVGIQPRPPVTAIGTLLTPAGVLSVDTISRLSRISPSAYGGSGPALLPARGYEALKVTFTWTPVDSPQGRATDPADAKVCSAASIPTFSIAADVESTLTPIHNGFASAPAPLSVAYVMSVPTKGRADLVVTTAGVKQAMSLTTGKPLQTSLNRAMDSTNRLAHLAENTSYIENDGTYWGNYTLTPSSTRSLALCPYDAHQGWAPAGMAWLVFHGSDALAGPANPLNPGSGIYVTLASYHGWTVTAAGKTYTPTVVTTNSIASAYTTTGLSGFFEGNPTKMTAYWQIPVSTTAATGALTTALNAKSDGEAVTRNPATLSFIPPPLRFSVSFAATTP